MYELRFIADLVEERIVKGHLRWLANFSEIRKDYAVEDITFPIYALGGLQEKGFFLSRIYSSLVMHLVFWHYERRVYPGKKETLFL